MPGFWARSHFSPPEPPARLEELWAPTHRTREKAFTAEAYPPHLAFFLLMIHLGDGRPDLSEQT